MQVQKMIMIPEQRYYKMLRTYDEAMEEIAGLKRALSNAGLQNWREKAHEKNPYDANDTMRMIGKNPVIWFMDNDVTFEILNDVMEARPYTATFETAQDLVMLGYIYGKRAERKRKKERLKRQMEREDEAMNRDNLATEIIRDLTGALQANLNALDAVQADARQIIARCEEQERQIKDKLKGLLP